MRHEPSRRISCLHHVKFSLLIAPFTLKGLRYCARSRPVMQRVKDEFVDSPIYSEPSGNVDAVQRQLQRQATPRSQSRRVPPGSRVKSPTTSLHCPTSTSSLLHNLHPPAHSLATDSHAPFWKPLKPADAQKRCFCRPRCVTLPACRGLRNTAM